MKKFFSLLCAVLVTTLVFGQSYGILVNGSTYFAGEPAGENEGFTQYLAHVPLQQGDYCQLYDAGNEAAWVVTLNQWSVEGFTLNNDRYEVAVDGCYDFYIKLKYQADELYIGNGSNCGEGVDISGGEEEPAGTAIYDWAGEIGTTILGASGVEVSTVKIHTNTDAVQGIKFGNSYAYADGKWIAIKPAQGGFKAGDKVNIAVCFNNSDDTKQAQIKAFAADGATELFMTAQGINGRTAATDPVVETFTLAADQDSILLGRYGNTATFITTLNVTRVAGEEPEQPEVAKFYVTGNAALVGQDKEWNPAAIKSMNDTLVLDLEANIDYVLKVAVNGTWEGENNVKGYNELTEKTAGLHDISNDHNIGFKLNEAGEVKVVYIAAEGENPEIFKLLGNFYVAPVEPTAKFYVTGNAALVGQDKEWNPAAIKSMSDTLVLNLEAEIDYVLKVAVNGTWEGENNVKGYNELSEKPEGLLDLGNDHNIGFRLAEAGEVKVVYIAAAEEQEEIFKVIGDFYVAPVEPTAKFYVTGNAALVGQELEWNPAAIPSMNDTLVLNLEANIDYILKVAVNGTWEGENNVKGYNELTDKTAGLHDISNDHNIGFKLNEAGEVKVVYIAAAEEQPEVFKVIGDFYVEDEPVLANGYYLVGTMNEWTPAAENLFAVNPDNEAEFQLNINLSVNDSIKVVYVENDAIVTWYPQEAGNYVVDANHAGATTMFFRPDYNGAEDWFEGCIFIVPTDHTDIETVDVDAKVVKVLRDGQILIIKGNKTFNAQGQIVK